MNDINIIISLGIILIPVILVGVVITRLNRNHWRHVQELLGKESEFRHGFHHMIEGGAIVISKSQIIVPNAGGFAKVDLRIEVQLPEKSPFQVSTCWLVKLDSLDQVIPGKIVPIEVDPNKPMRIFPNVPWAKLWIFGKYKSPNSKFVQLRSYSFAPSPAANGMSSPGKLSVVVLVLPLWLSWHF